MAGCWSLVCVERVISLLLHKRQQLLYGGYSLAALCLFLPCHPYLLRQEPYSKRSEYRINVYLFQPDEPIQALS